MKRLIISEQTKKRCKITPTKSYLAMELQDLLPDKIPLLFGIKNINFSLYLRLPEYIIEYIKPGEYNVEDNKLLIDLIKASKKDNRAYISIKRNDYDSFQLLIDLSRNEKLKRLLNLENIDPMIAKTYDIICRTSQAIFSEGLTPEVMENAEIAITNVINNITQNQKAMTTLNNIILMDPSLYDHSASVSIISSIIANKLLFKGKPSPAAVREAARCGLFHDAGKMMISPEILNKPGKLTPEEFEKVKKHPEFGKAELANSDLPPIVSIVAYQHHERFRGGGYPLGLHNRYEENKETGIHIFSRICMIADVYSALLSKRSYRDSLPQQTALGIMLNEMKDHFDPQLLKIFVELITESLSDNSVGAINYKTFLKQQLASIDMDLDAAI